MDTCGGHGGWAASATDNGNSGALSASKSRRRRAAPRNRDDSARRNACRVGRLVARSVCARHARWAPMPTSHPVTTSSPASTRAGEEASEPSNHAESTRSSRASIGSSQPGPTPKAPQSRNTSSPDGRWSRLSLRMSKWTTWSFGWASSASVRSSSAGSSSSTHGGSQPSGTSGAWASPSRAARKASRRSTGPGRNRGGWSSGGAGAGGSGTRSASVRTRSSVCAMSRSMVASSDRSGWVPSTSSSRIATQPPSSYDASRSAHRGWLPTRSAPGPRGGRARGSPGSARRPLP